MDFKQKIKTFVKQVPSSLGPLSDNFRSGRDRSFSLHSAVQQATIGLSSSATTTTATPSTGHSHSTPEELKRIQDRLSQLVNAYTKHKESRQLQVQPFENDERLQNQIIESIEKQFFDTKQFDADQHVLNKLPSQLDVGFLLNERQNLDRQLQVVSRKVSSLIVQHKSLYEQGLQQANHLQQSLSGAINTCTNGRQHLTVAKQSLTHTSLTIVANYNKRELLRRLLNEIIAIKMLQDTENSLKDMIDFDEDFTGAIRLCLQCERAAGELYQYKCVTSLTDRLQRIVELIEQQMSSALAKMCDNFNAESYHRLQSSYRTLGKSAIALDQLLMHFVSTVHDRTFSIVYGYVQLFSGRLSSSQSSQQNNEMLRKKNFDQLCRQLTGDSFIPCLTDLNKSYYQLMLNYKRIAAWHESSLQSNEMEEDQQQQQQEQQQSSFLDQEFVQQKLQHAAKRIWQEMGQKLRMLISLHDLSSYSLDDLISVLRLVSLIKNIGQEFCSLESTELEETLKKATANYFHVFHRNKMEELRVYMETEMWALFPIRKSFSMKQLHDFKLLEDRNRFSRVLRSPSKQNDSPGEAVYFSKVTLNCEEIAMNFFEPESDESESMILNQLSPDGDCSADNTDKEEEEEDGGFEDNKSGQEPFWCLAPDSQSTELSADNRDKSFFITPLADDERVAIVTNSTINMMRIIGKYMQIMCMLNQISFDVLLCIFQLFDFYLYGVYAFFGKEMHQLAPASVSITLKQILNRIETTLIQEFASDGNKIRYHLPQLNELVKVNLDRKECLYGLSERAIAVESLIFLANELQSIYPLFESLTSADHHHWLDQYFTTTVQHSHELRTPVYKYVATRSIQYDQVLQSISNVNWEVKEIMSLHNVYVDELIRELQIFYMRQTEIVRRQMGCRQLPRLANEMLWTQICLLANRTFIEGFANARKCTPEGRALMQLDYQQFLSKMEKMVWLKPLPDKELVDEFIKAYYYTEEQLEQLICAKKDFTAKQLKALINCVMNDNKKGRIRLINLIENESN